MSDASERVRSRRSRELFVIFRSVCSGNSGIFYTFALCSLFLRLLSSRRTTTRRDKSWAVAVSLFLFSLSFLLLSCLQKGNRHIARFSPFSSVRSRLPRLRSTDNRIATNARYDAKYALHSATSLQSVLPYATYSTVNYVGGDMLSQGRIAEIFLNGFFRLNDGQLWIESY